MIKLILLISLFLTVFQVHGAMIIDHHCIDFRQIPTEWILKAKQDLRVGYGHTSHGSQLVTGFDALKAAKGAPFDFPYAWGFKTGIFFNDQCFPGAEDLGHNGDLSWRDATLNILQRGDNDRNVVIWSWCGGVSDNSVTGINTYLQAMAQLEQQYPQITFVYMTGHLDGSGRDGNLHLRNEQIRSFCRQNNKVLFDFADIESFAPGSTTDYMALLATDGCQYDRNGDGNPWGDGNWADEWIQANPAHEFAAIATLCSDCAHSEKLNCVLKGGAFWWLLARLAGWQGTTWVSESPVVQPEKAQLIGTYPNPFNSSTRIVYDLRSNGFVNLTVFDLAGRAVANWHNGMQTPGRHTLTWSPDLLASGNYVCRLEVITENKRWHDTRSILLLK